MVFLKEALEDDEDRKRVRDALIRYDQNKQRVEASFNMVEVPSLFGRKMDELSEDEDEWLASTLAATWREKLRVQYPTRTFEVRVVTPAESGGEVAVLFHRR